MKIVVVSPHRNDAAFPLALAIQSWLAAGHTVSVLNCFTRTEHAPFSDADSVHPNDRLHYVTAVRFREDETWQRQCGPGLTMIDLNLKDAPLRLHCAVTEVRSKAPTPGEKAFLKIPKALEKLTVDALVLPLAIGNHVDHLTARDAALEYAAAAPGPLAFYEDLPAVTRTGGLESIEVITAALNLSLEPAFASAPMEDPADTKEAVQRKRRAVLCYDSQVDDDVVDQIAEFSTRYGGRERLWANAAWRASELATAE